MRTLREVKNTPQELAEEFGALLEASFSRLFQHFQERPIGIITAFRRCNTREKNRERNRVLAKELRAAGYGFIRAHGYYPETGDDGEKKKREEVFIVVGDVEDADGSKLQKKLTHLGYKWNQDSVFIKPANSDNAKLVGTQDIDRDCKVGEPVWPGRNKVARLGKWEPNKIGLFYSKMTGRTFVFTLLDDGEVVEELDLTGRVYSDSSMFGAWAKHLIENCGHKVYTEEEYDAILAKERAEKQKHQSG
ncbi:MAG: hypothetical protein BV459_06020 [Thermoplasmata archaeon M11B2D]|nr:MAG: hypothetical protein BV459_06020 [Thermoplasmata archaeon M11B2D]